MKSLVFMFIMGLCSLKIHSQTIDPKIQEVYAAKTQELVAQNPDWLVSMNDFIQNRVTVSQIILDPINDKYKKLSEVKLINKYNPDLQRDVVFDPTNFNPLKYDFVFSAKSTMVYRVDNTNYVIVIAPQSFK
jgi:hypothetical protein